jgi:hypothetical protein
LFLRSHANPVMICIYVISSIDKQVNTKVLFA